jgi:hypothetical protein
MNISPKLSYEVHLTARELKMIRRALNLEGSKFAKEMAQELTNRAGQAAVAMDRHFKSFLTIETSSEEIE